MNELVKKAQEKECPFRPAVKDNPKRSNDKEELIGRLISSRKSIEEKLEKERDEIYNATTDPHTG